MLPLLLPLTTVLLLTTLASRTFSKQEASNLVDTHLLPQTKYGERTRLGRDVFQNNKHEQVIRADDPRTSFTYGEFPLDSVDTLLDIALEHVGVHQEQQPQPFLRVLDLGSGCGRLCLYLALSRKDWQVHGIEVMDSLHNEAKRATHVAIENGWFFVPGTSEEESSPTTASTTTTTSSTSTTTTTTSLNLHHGLAEEFPGVLQQADIIFMYSTAMQSGPFVPAVQGLLLSRDWNEMLTRYCKPGCIVVTTDRALDPDHGWVHLNRLDVPNPEVFGSTGFIQQKKSS
eukprot:scaffold54_cov158-Amphora_coffeaeformis.AAC.4